MAHLENGNHQAKLRSEFGGVAGKVKRGLQSKLTPIFLLHSRDFHRRVRTLEEYPIIYLEAMCMRRRPL